MTLEVTQTQQRRNGSGSVSSKAHLVCNGPPNTALSPLHKSGRRVVRVTPARRVSLPPTTLGETPHRKASHV